MELLLRHVNYDYKVVLIYLLDKLIHINTISRFVFFAFGGDKNFCMFVVSDK